nr:MAG TPA: DNA polymerase III subunit alpha [Caudoviricetes sp.]
MFEKYNKLVILDTETTGLNKDTNEIIEFAALVMTKRRNGKFETAKEIDFFIQNEEPIPEFITNLTHITNEMCKEGYSKERTVQEFRDLFDTDEKTLVIIYNTPFDMGFIKSFMNKYSDGFINRLDTLDLLEVAKARTGRMKGNKLCDMIVRYSIEDEENSHRAIDDVKATLAVMRAMYKEKKDIEKYIRCKNW